MNQNFSIAISAAKRLKQASYPIRILRNLAWSVQLRENFFKHKAQKLPKLKYAKFNADSILRETDAILAQPTEDSIHDWVKQKTIILQDSARLLASRGSADFYHYSKKLYGTPEDTIIDGKNTALEFATRLGQSLEYYNSLSSVSALRDAKPHFDAKTAAEKIRQKIIPKFGKNSPDVIIVKHLSARATASSRRIRLRANAQFSEDFINQLIQHEAYIHVATAKNGRLQRNMPILGLGHPGTTTTQEGLAVFSEFITGTMDMARMNRLSDRVVAIQMAVDGADFIEVYRYFEAKGIPDVDAYENTRRVFRGGVITGGAPFTKDMVYLNGLLRVHNFLRAIVNVQRVDLLNCLFVGKLDLDDVPIIAEMLKHKICTKPKYLPDWIEDKEFLLSYLAYSSFLNQVDMQQVTNHYDQLLEQACMDF